MFPSIKSPNTRQLDASEGFSIKGGAGITAKQRRSVLRVLMAGKADASLDPKRLQKAYSKVGVRDQRANHIRELDRGRRFPKSKFVTWDEFSGRWRLNGGDKADQDLLLRISIEVANAISGNQVSEKELGVHFSDVSPEVSRIELFHIFHRTFPTVSLMPRDLTSIAKHLSPIDYEHIHPEHLLVALLRYAASHLEGGDGNDIGTPERSSVTEEERRARTKNLFKKLKGHSVLRAEDGKRKKEKRGRHRHALQNAMGPGGMKQDVGTLYRMRVKVDREERARTNAIEKLTRAAAHFGGRTGQLEGFKGSDMTKEQFGEELKKAFNMRLKAEELNAISEVFDMDGDGLISCEEFLNLFFRMKRKVELEKTMERRTEEGEKKRKEMEKELEEKKKYLVRCEDCIEEWTSDDLKNAVELIAEVAAGWDQSKAGFAGLQGLQCNGMDAMELREQLWRTFDLTFTKAELGALVDTFDLDGDGTVDGAEFLSMFFRLQKKEQAFRKRQDNALKVQVRAKEELRELEEIKREEERMKNLVDDEDWGEQDLEEGLKKIKAAGRNNLARFLKIFLTPKQVGAVVAHFDKDAGGTLDGGEFLKGCWDLWREVDKEEHQRNMQHRKEHRDKWEGGRKAREQEIEDKLNSIKLGPFGKKDLVSALKKLRKAAIMHDDRVNISLQSFQGPPMTPYQFKDLLKRVLKIKLTIAELSSLVGHFDSDGDETVSGSEFLSAFFAIRRDEQRKVVEENRREERRQMEHLEKLKEEHRLKAEEDDLTCEYAVHDLRKAIQKLKGAAESFNPRSQSLGGFLSGGAMCPREFKAELKKALSVKLTNQQLSALFSEWDSDGDGTIDSAEFLSHFYKFRQAV